MVVSILSGIVSLVVGLIVAFVLALALIGGFIYFLYWLITSWSSDAREEAREKDHQQSAADESDRQRYETDQGQSNRNHDLTEELHKSNRQQSADEKSDHRHSESVDSRHNRERDATDPSESSSGTAESRTDWTQVNSPTNQTLFDVVASSNGPYAVGASGRMLARRNNAWEVVMTDGPTGELNTLRSAAVTTDGQHVWFCGGSGVVGQYDVTTDQVTDYSAPHGKTSTWLGVAVTGSAGDEQVYLMNGSGEFLAGQKTVDGMVWGTAVKPGGGASAPGIDFHGEKSGRVCDTNGKVYETTNGGESWKTIGIKGVSVGLYDIVSVTSEEVTVVGGNGSIFCYDGNGKWREQQVSQSVIQAIARGDTTNLAAGGNGYIYEQTNTGWKQIETPTTNTLHGVASNADGTAPAVAVGNSGTILERRETTFVPLPPEETRTPLAGWDEIPPDQRIKSELDDFIDRVSYRLNI